MTSLGNPTLSYAAGVSADGGVIVGAKGPFDGALQPYTWDNGRVTTLPFTLPSSTTLDEDAVAGVSADGSLAAGTYGDGLLRPTQAARWNTHSLSAPAVLTEAGTIQSKATALSPDGSIIAGIRAVLNAGDKNSHNEGFIWRPDVAIGGVSGLGSLPAGQPSLRPYDISDGGKFIVGMLGNSRGGNISQAFIWDAEHGIQILQDVLISEGLGPALSGWTLSIASAITPDGQTIVGSGINPKGRTQAWVVHRDLAQPQQPDISLGVVTTTDAESVSVKFTVSNADIKSPVKFLVYRSSQPTKNDGSRLLGSEDIDEEALKVGPHTVRLIDGFLLKPDPSMPYVVVESNFSDSNNNNNTGYFRKYLLGVISQGYNPDIFGETPVWQLQLPSILKAQKYDDTISYSWVAETQKSKPGQAEAAGLELVDKIRKKANSLVQMNQHEGDVVDLHLIGHSRGSVVIGQAYLSLKGDTESYLIGSYRKMTMIDPHPASNKFGDQFSVKSNSFLASALKFNIITFQNLAEDPRVIVPDNVHDSELIYQHTNVQRFYDSGSVQRYINLWGHDLSLIDNKSRYPIRVTDLTDVWYTGIGYIGHSEIPYWYIESIAKKTKELFD